MSLLEDVFLEDEAGEAQELERVIEGDEYDERPLFPDSDDNEEKDDEAEEDKRRVDPTQASTKRVVKNPRVILNPARLTGPRGIQVIPDHFKDFKFKGKGHEKQDLDMVLKKLEHWAYRLYPKFGFSDCLKKIEMLGSKRPVMVHRQKIRSDQFMSEEAVVQKDSSDEETEAPVQEEDEFDKLLQQQIELARATPAPGSVKKTFSTPSVDRSLMMPKATSSPSISDEQRERMLRNRRLAEERRLAKLKNDDSVTESSKENNHEVITEPEVNKEVTEEVVTSKHNRSHVIDSSDDEEPILKKSIAVDVHGLVHDEMEIVEFNNKNEKSTQKSLEIIPESRFARKHNKSNVIDSSDEDEPIVNESITVDVELNDKNEDNAPSQQTRPKVIDEVLARKHNRSNVIDSSDDDEPIVNKSIADLRGLVDVETEAVEFTNKNETSKHNSLEVISESRTSRKHNKSNVIDSSDEDEPTVNRCIAVDVELNNRNEDNATSNVNNQEVITKPQNTEVIEEVFVQKHNETNSSSNPSVNRSYSVDDDTGNEVNDVEISDSSQDNKTTIDKSRKTTNVTEDHLKTETDKTNMIQENTDKLDITTQNSSQIDKESKLRVGECSNTKVNNEHDNSPESNELGIDIVLSNVNNDNSKHKDEPEVNKENVNIIDEVMDVDFSDEW